MELSEQKREPDEKEERFKRNTELSFPTARYLRIRNEVTERVQQPNVNGIEYVEHVLGPWGVIAAASVVQQYRDNRENHHPLVVDQEQILICEHGIRTAELQTKRNEQHGQDISKGHVAFIPAAEIEDECHHDAENASFGKGSADDCQNDI